MMNEEDSGLLLSELTLMGNVIGEVLWVVRHQQRDTADTTNTKSVKISLRKLKQENSTCTYIVKECASYAIAQHMTIQDFLKGPVEQLRQLLHRTQGRSECILRIGSHQYSLMRNETIRINTVHQVGCSMNEAHDNYFEFHLKIQISKSFEMEHKEMELKVEENLQRYKMTNPEVIISLQSTLSGCERLRTFPFNATNHTIKIGGLPISVEPRNHVSEAHVQNSRVTNVRIGQPIQLSSTTSDPSIIPTSYCQIGYITIGYDSPGGGAYLDMNNSKIKIFIHGPDGVPLFEGREIPFTRDLKKILEMDCLDVKIDDEPIHGDNAEGNLRPDLMFKATSRQWQTPKGRKNQQRPPTLALILHLVLFLEDHELISIHHSIIDCLEGLRQKFCQCFQEIESCLKSDIKQSFLELLEKRSEKSSRQRHKEEALERAVPTVVEAITTIISNSTNETFRKNCLAYAGATDTMELASFLTDNLTGITTRTLYPRDEHLDCSGPSELEAAVTDKDSFSLLSDHQDGNNVTEELEELNDLDLLQAFSQGTDDESFSGELHQDTDDDALLGAAAESDQWTGLSQTTDEIVKSLLEEDTFDEDLLSSDWLITEE